MMTTGKTYEMDNGYKVAKARFSDLWTVWTPSGGLYMAFPSFREACEVASHLRPEYDI